MAKFDYVLSNQTGLRTEGTISAPTKDAAIKKLREENKIIISVIEKKSKFIFSFGKVHLNMQDKMLFTKHLATMIKVGIPITEALEILANQTKKPRVKAMYEDIIEMIKSGQSLAKSLRKYDFVFGELFINMIETGEESGNLEKVLEYLDMQLDKEYEMRKKILSAFIYPIVIMSITLLMAIGIVIFIMPKITKIFENFKINLPLPTKILIGFSTFLVEKPFISILILIFLISFFVTIFKLKILKPIWHRLTIHLPVFGSILIAANVALFSRTLNSLLQAGVPITEGLRIIANMLDNHIYKNAINKASDKVEQGGKLGESFEEYEKLFPEIATKMLFIGEKTGSLEITTSRLAELYENIVDSKTKNLSVLLEPLLLVFMASLVGGIAMSIILPIYQLPNLINK